MEVSDIWALALSILAIVISLGTTWITVFRRGRLRITQPTVIYLGPDGKQELDKNRPPKVYIRTLLFSTGKRGLTLASLYVRLTRNETGQNFNIWVHGEEKLVRGSGLFVGETGLVTNHHFLLPKDGTKYEFRSGSYHLELFALALGKNSPVKLWEQTLEVTDKNAEGMVFNDCGLYFDWAPDSKNYLAHLDKPTDKK